MRRPWPAIRAARTGSTGRPFAGSGAVRWETWWRRRRPSAARRRPAGQPPSPFHGYYFRILTAQGPAAPGGASDYVAGGELSRGFALVAWPARYDATGVMTFVVNQDGVVRERDLGPAADGAGTSVVPLRSRRLLDRRALTDAMAFPA